MEFVSPANSNELLKNTVLPFILDNSGIRGRFVRLNEEVHKILSSHRYPLFTSQLLGELLVLVSMLGSMLKLNGLVSIQAQGDGAIGFISADYTHEGHLRGYAHIKDRKRLQAAFEASREPDIKDLFGKGHVLITVENRGEKPYQAIIPLEGKSMTGCITNYFRQSEQLNATIEVAARKINRKWHAGGILLQKIAEEGGKHKKAKKDHEEEWNNACIMLESVTEKELIDDNLPPNTLLFRLFHEHGVRVFEPQKLEAKCRCSRTRMQEALINMSPEEIESLKVKGKIKITCQFCSRTEVFQ